MKNRIMRYLADGVKPANISTIVGCKPSYISQLLADEDFQAQLAELIEQTQAEPDIEEKSLTSKYVTMEHKLLASMEGALADAKLSEITRALEVVAKRQIDTKALNRPAPQTTNVTMVSLTLPATSRIHVPQVVMNETQEVVAIGNDVLAPMSSEGVKSMFQQLKERKQNVTADAIQEQVAIPADF